MRLHAVPRDAPVAYGRLISREQCIGIQIVESPAQDLKLHGRQVSGYLRGSESAHDSRRKGDAAAVEGDRRSHAPYSGDYIVQIRTGKGNLQLIFDGAAKIQAGM